MSNDERPEFTALSELEQVLTSLSEELSSWRHRAQRAEAQHAELGADHDAVAARERIVELEKENADLGQRLDAARHRVDDLISRLRFLEEQVALEEQNR